MKTSKSKRPIYLNPKQDQFLQAFQKTKAWVGGRGTGKTTNIGDHEYDFTIKMPRSKGFLLNKTFGQAYTKTLPEVLDRMRQYGIKEHISEKQPGHYVVCKTPPKWFAEPYKKPRKYDNTITFWNGRMIDLLSFDRPDLARGGSYDSGVLDEAALIDSDKYVKTIRPLLRGDVRKWDHRLRFSLLMYTSRAWKTSGKWIEQNIKRLAAEHPDKFYYMETSAEDNIEVLGKEYFERAKLEMNPIEYAVEILNQPITKLPNGFYSHLDEEIHLYSTAADYDYDDEHGKWHIKEESDINKELPLDVSFDFNAEFTSCTIWQDLRPELNELRCMRNLYVKYQQVTQLVDIICKKYAGHPKKIVNIFGGKDGHTRRTVISEYNFFQVISQKFKDNGWEAYIQADINYSDKEHKLKWEVINLALKEIDPDVPVIRLHEENAKETYISMNNAPIRGDFKKDKKSEDDESVEQEYATHLSDTVDNYVFQKIRKIATKTNSFPSIWTG
jgi:hypothetical protein